MSPESEVLEAEPRLLGTSITWHFGRWRTLRLAYSDGSSRCTLIPHRVSIDRAVQWHVKKPPEGIPPRKSDQWLVRII
ncbi:hypothetical protein BABINDRAFT_161440 [Babjeviella inositovora NRRL Y-12698]|uniref:Uncharacterized protein n=1 Tax=Babjeviella inositovora NRRL Y-12698 TaxID=984486 RepID=A0A1E3QPV8_9ASCO|nr:uncharacterized protein BABINDRAFT_161440 [Babjeviella inositovora NRRL Y-12698]ODQ79733.1 hypothetical protein BABINDRAFT_161440 [Babjeviella inositovora NRRL Y-12698]